MYHWLLYAFITFNNGILAYPLGTYAQKTDCLDAKIDIASNLAKDDNIEKFTLVCQKKKYNFDYDNNKILIKGI